MLPKLLRRKSLLLHFSLELAGVVGASSLARLGAALAARRGLVRDPEGVEGHLTSLLALSAS